MILKRAVNYQLSHACRLAGAISLMFLFTTACFAQVVSSTELIDQAKTYDGKEVVYCGEVIGDVMARGDYVWINLADGKGAIGIWAKKDLLPDIVYTGNYKFKGDVVEVRGIFHRACVEHGGDLDIHAVALSKVISGEAVQEVFSRGKRNLVILLSGALLLVWIFTLLKRR